MPEKTNTAKPAAPDAIAAITDALAAAGIERAVARQSDGVHDTVITVTIPKGP